MSLPVVKHSYLVRSARELLTVMPEAFRIAASGRQGPVLVDVPKDVQLERVEFALLARALAARPARSSPRPRPSSARPR